jgi:hypothetical protein
MFRCEAEAYNVLVRYGEDSTEHQKQKETYLAAKAQYEKACNLAGRDPYNILYSEAFGI